jgi:hypothetical protein
MPSVTSIALLPEEQELICSNVFAVNLCGDDDCNIKTNIATNIDDLGKDNIAG